MDIMDDASMSGERGSFFVFCLIPGTTVCVAGRLSFLLTHLDPY